MAKQQTPTSLSQALTAIILNADKKLTKDQNAEQRRVWQEVQRMIFSGKTEIEFTVLKNGTKKIKPTASNIRAVKEIAKRLGSSTSLNNIKKAVGNYNKAAAQISKKNQAGAKREFAGYVHKPRFAVPLDELTERVKTSVLRDQYTEAFQQPIKDLIMTHVKEGLDFDTMVAELEKSITGIVPTDEGTAKIQRGLLEKYHSLKLITRQAMFHTLAEETDIIAEQVGRDTVWYLYVGGKVDDTRDECLRRIGLRYFSFNEVKSWDKLTKEQWPEKIPNVSPFIQRGGWNCLHDLRIVSIRRVPMSRIDESFKKGFLNEQEYKKAVAQKKGTEPAKVETPVIEPEEETKTAEQVQQQPDSAKVGTAPLNIPKIDLRKEIGIRESAINFNPSDSKKYGAWMKKQGLANGFNERHSFSGLNIDTVQEQTATMMALKQRYGYVTSILDNDSRLKLGRSQVKGSLLFYKDYTVGAQKNAGFTLRKGGGGLMNANGSSIGLSPKFGVSGGQDGINKRTGVDYRKKTDDLLKSKRFHVKELEKLLSKATKQDEIDLFTYRIQRATQSIEKLENERFFTWTVGGRDYWKDDPFAGIKSSTIHEFGHVLHDQTTGGINPSLRLTGNVLTDQEARNLNNKLGRVYRKYRNDTDFKSRIFSEYGMSQQNEFFAEAFVIYSEEPGVLPDDITSLLTEFMTAHQKQQKYMNENNINWN